MIISSLLRERKQSKIISKLAYGKGEKEFFLISFPKSGNTWVRFLLANLLKEQNEVITLKNIGNYVPDIYVAAQRENVLNKNSLFNSLTFKFLKTHDPYYKIYKDKKVVYLVRDGRDTLNSYFYYLQARTPEKISLKNLILGEKGGEYGIWSRHVLGWLKGDCKRKLIVKYEDILNDARNEVKKILNFLLLEIDEKKIESAIVDSSFERLKDLEDKYGGINKVDNGRMVVPFFRKGKVGDWKNNFKNEDEELFWKIHGKAMEALGYNK